MVWKLTREEVFWLFILAVWVYNAFALLDLFNITRIQGALFYILTSLPPIFMFLYIIAKPPEPNFMTVVKVGGTSVAILSILAGIHAYMH
ncbi:hypothetical protein [Pyrococcus sp. ST04]|uniref:hypothetical protein n=1 Tax=Pyrococcus sp. ST04 TaxID=1183377 RepID=UPI0002605977|nr:hypothetical protein [Pyrococcus sp. ST04]AFK21800.1 hypothetical protein Py04_0196 [Pyrococcus sp. ST04]